jgi:hypothetical protein
MLYELFFQDDWINFKIDSNKQKSLRRRVFECQKNFRLPYDFSTFLLKCLSKDVKELLSLPLSIIKCDCIKKHFSILAY